MQLNSLTEEELKELMPKYNEKAFRGSQLFNFFHAQKKTDFSTGNLPKKLVEELEKFGAQKKIIEKCSGVKLNGRRVNVEVATKRR